ncbi:MAG: helix-turn-helix domain-containing protein [Rubrobacteraceae bacterium]
MTTPQHQAATRDEPSIRRLFGQRARKLRRERGYSQERFAMISGLDRSYYGGVERGERNVSLDNIAAIAQALDVPVSELFAPESVSGR